MAFIGTHVKYSPFKRASLPQGTIKNTLSFYAYLTGKGALTMLHANIGDHNL